MIVHVRTRVTRRTRVRVVYRTQCSGSSGTQRACTYVGGTKTILQARRCACFMFSQQTRSPRRAYRVTRGRGNRSAVCIAGTRRRDRGAVAIHGGGRNIGPVLCIRTRGPGHTLGVHSGRI